MNKFFAIAIAAIMAVSVVPTANAETIESAYLTSSGAWLTPAEDNDLPAGNAIVVCPDALAWPLDPDWDPVEDPLGENREPIGCNNPDPIIPHIGSATFYMSSAYGNAAYTPSDDLTGSNAPIAGCLWDPDNNANACRPNHAWSDFACGSALVTTNGEFLSPRGTVFVFTVLVESDFGVCVGTSGTVVGDFF